MISQFLHPVSTNRLIRIAVIVIAAVFFGLGKNRKAQLAKNRFPNNISGGKHSCDALTVRGANSLSLKLVPLVFRPRL